MPGAARISGKRLGLTIASYHFRWHSPTESDALPAFNNALDVMDHCRKLNAGCLQIGVRNWTSEFAGKVREKREKIGILLEGQIRLPKDKEDLDRFESELKAGKEAGATILRTVCLSGRRYETFHSAEDWSAFVKNSYASLTLAEPIMKKHRVKLAVENHKDWRIEEMLQLLRHFDSEWIGVNLDTGNNIALLDDPMEVVEVLAPFTLTTHLKDMGVEEMEEGFLLSEVPLGEGFLDIARIVELCERSNPAVQFNLEMITRDPLRIPVLEEDYWATFHGLPAEDLARTMRMVRDHRQSLPRISHLNQLGQLRVEEENVLQSFRFAQKILPTS